MMTMIPQQKVNDIAEEITKKVMESLGKNFQKEFQKVEEEFQKMGKYINELHYRIDQLEKDNIKKGELQDSNKPDPNTTFQS